MSTPNQHAMLSASSSERWLHCTRAPRLEAQFPDSTSDYAAAGTLAHAIAELKARKYFIEPMSPRTFNNRLKKLKSDPHYEKGMDAATDTYLEHLKSIAMSFNGVSPFVALETRVDFSGYVPGGFGTADCIIIGSGKMYVCDYKNGSGVSVAAENNTQMQLYALGALKAYAPIYGNTIQDIHLHIIQPNAGGIKEWSLPRAALEAWAQNIVRPQAALAHAGKGDFVPGDWCQFCRAKAQCTARAAQMLGIEPHTTTSPDLISDEELGTVLSRAMRLEAWVKDLKDYALASALAGQKINGFKLVEGRGSRTWTDLDTAFEALKSRGVAEAMLWERKPVTPPALEKSMGKKAFEESASDLVSKSPGKPTLVPESDPRKPYNAAEMAFKNI